MQIGILEPHHFSQKAKKSLEKYGAVAFYNNEKLVNFLAEKEVLFIRLKYKLDEEFLKMSPKLKYICTPTTGLNHLNLEIIHKKEIIIISLKGESEFLSTIRATPEHTLGLLLSLLRKYKKAFLNTSNTQWNRDLYKGYEIYGKNIGIIGLGRVGKILCKYFEVFGAKIIYTDIQEVEAPKNCRRIKTNNELIKQSDIIFLTASYSKKYEKMIDKKAIDKMKDKFFINTARGELVDEDYLLQKISANHFKGIALDVINDETNIDEHRLNTFLSLCDKHNFILTSHIAGATYESMWRTEEYITNKLTKVLK